MSVQYNREFLPCMKNEVAKLKYSIFMHGGHGNPERSIIFRQFARVAGCVQTYMLVQKSKIGITEF